MPTPWAESADLVARFRALDSAGVVGDALVPSSPPPPATARLDTHGLVWSDLTALAKEALLWDMGFVRASTFPDDVAQVYTACAGTSNMGDSMASIAVSEAAFLASQANATVRACAGADGNYSRQENAHGMFLGKVVKCAVPLLPDTTTPNSYASMWAQDGLDATTVPDPRLWRHEWHSIGFPSFLLFAIHTVPAQFAETAWGKCPSTTSPGSLIVPCTVYKPSNYYSSLVFSPPNVEWCLPRPSTAMDKWLATIHDAKTHRDTPEPAVSTLTIVLIVVLAVLLLGLIACFCLRRRRQRGSHNNGSSSPTSSYYHATRPTIGTGSGHGSSQAKQTITTSSKALNAFQEDPYLCSKRLPYSSITYSRMLSKGAFGEVWLGTLADTSSRTRLVAIKRILDAKRADPAELECFASEIRLMALFSHPHIVHFLGFGWNTLQNMCAVTEYLEHGDVSAYLAAHSNVASDVKLSIGLGVLNAVQYLHSLNPPVIHRDLKGRNVLLSDDLDAKLSDFGISRQRIADETMTVGVGTAFWTAPEVLLGLKYDASVDVYSFGVIMTELDTQHAPYADMKGVPSMHIVQKVTGQDGAATPLRPTLTRDAPAWFVATATACLDRDPARRPSIAELRDRFAQALGALRADARL